MEDRTLMMQVRHTNCRWQQYMRRITLEAGIPDGYRRIIMFLHFNPGAMQTALAQDSIVTDAAISRTINDMETEGYIVRSCCETDKRAKRLYLTSKGEDSYQRIHEKLLLANERIQELITPEAARLLKEELYKIEQMLAEELKTE